MFAKTRLFSDWLFSICTANHQFQSGPGFINSAHLYIDESERQCDGANHIFRHIGIHASRSLWPGNPNRPGVRDFLAQHNQSLFQVAAACGEEVNKVRRFLDLVRKVGVVRDLPK